MRLGGLLERAHSRVGRIFGRLAMALELRKPIPASVLRHWAKVLRETAEEIENFVEEQNK